MVWPTDDLTVAHLDAATDDPSQARTELLNAVNKLKSILGEVAAGQTVFHSGNDGAGSSLDADLLDGQHGSYYRNATNLNAGTISASRIGADSITASHLASNSVGSSELIAGSVGQTEIASGGVHQSELDTSLGEVSTDTNDTDDNLGTTATKAILPGGTYGFYPQFKSEDGTTVPRCHIYYDASLTTNTTYQTDIMMYNDIGSIDKMIYAQQRYINSSPPYDIGDGDIPLFVFLNYNKKLGKVKGYYVADTPPWAYNGPTSIKPDRVENGKKYKILTSIDSETGEVSKREILIDKKYQNADINVIPHPFKLDPDYEVILLDPCETLYLKDLHDVGESISTLFKKDYLRLRNDTIKRATPRDVKPCCFQWKNSKRFAAVIEDKEKVKNDNG